MVGTNVAADMAGLLTYTVELGRPRDAAPVEVPGSPSLSEAGYDELVAAFGGNRTIHPGPEYDEPHATLTCGRVTVSLSYTMLNRICGYLAVGNKGDSEVKISGEICRAFEAIRREASDMGFNREGEKKS